MSHPERIVPDETEPGVVAVHLKRYVFAEPLCAGGEVLDAACGVGYGSAYLGRTAARVLGVDVSADALAYARSRYAAPNVEFARMDVLALDLPDASFDAVCSFETIEHVAEPERAVAELARVLRPGGVCVLSTPRVDATVHDPANPFHAVELSPADFEELLRGSFGEVELYGQRRLRTRRYELLHRLDVLGLRRRLPLRRAVSAAVLGTPATEDVGLDDVVIERGRVDGATELVAVCRRPRQGRSTGSSSS